MKTTPPFSPRFVPTLALAVVFLCVPVRTVSPCTNLLVTKGASADGSVMMTYTADSAGFYGALEIYPAEEFPEGTLIEIPAKGERPASTIPQVRRTCHVIGASGHGLMNEHQLVLAETTFGGRDELHNPTAPLDYPTLMTLALQRAKTAREAIRVITELCETHGYGDVGESISLGDTEEAWVLEIVGTGKDAKPEDGKCVWVARRVPDGQISAHANQARIREFPADDPENCVFSKNVVSFAVSRGYYDPSGGEPFRFDEAYAPADAKSKRVCEARVWSLYRRAAPSREFSADYHRGKPDAEPYPWAITPDEKLTLADVKALMRDHYNGTEFDMSKGLDAGPFGLPRRWRPLYWTIEDTEEAKDTADADGKPKSDVAEYSWERPISTQQTAYSIVSQSRGDLPNCVGGRLWYGVDDTYLSCYFPVFCCVTDLPEPFATGSIDRFSWDSAWWVFNLVSNYANLKYDTISPEIIAVQQAVEGQLRDDMGKLEQAVKARWTPENDDEVRAFLTELTVDAGDILMETWQELAGEIFTKFNDGYVREDDPEKPGQYKYPNIGYPRPWLRRVVEENPEKFLLPKEEP